MAPVSIKFVVSFSSQDDNYKVSNLTNSDGFRKWLSHPKEKSGQIEAVFQLDHSCVISYIDIGVHWCALLEIQVGRSDWPQDKGYVTLVPTVSLMSPAECRLGNSCTKTRMFGQDDFSEDACNKKWDRIKVVCRQPFRKDIQYGLSFIRIRSKDVTETKTLNIKSPNVKSVECIQKHFFGKAYPSKQPEDELKSRLMKIAGSSENGMDHHQAMPRTAKLVLAASEGNKTPKSCDNTIRPALYSSHLSQKYGPQFEEETDNFLSTYEIEETQLDKITIADIRHKFEKTKKRKLTSEEKKVFVKKARDHICNLFGDKNLIQPQNSANGAQDNFNKLLSNGDKNSRTPSDQKANKYGYSWKSSAKVDPKSMTPNEKNFMKLDENKKTGIEKNCVQSATKSWSNTPTSMNKNSPSSAENNQTNSVSSSKTSGSFMKKAIKNTSNSEELLRLDPESDKNNFTKIGLKQMERFSATFATSMVDPPVKSPNLCTTNDEWLTSVRDDNTSPAASKGKGKDARKRLLSDASDSKGKRSKGNKNNHVIMNNQLNQTENTGRGRGRGRKNSGKGGRVGKGRGTADLSSEISYSPGNQIQQSSEVSRKTTPLSAYSTPSPVTYGYIQTDNTRQDTDCFMTHVQTNSDVRNLQTVSDSKFMQPEFIECPICSEFFSKDGIEFHASICCELNFN